MEKMSMESLISSENEVRVVDALVDGMEMKSPGFEFSLKEGITTVMAGKLFFCKKRLDYSHSVPLEIFKSFLPLNILHRLYLL